MAQETPEPGARARETQPSSSAADAGIEWGRTVDPAVNAEARPPGEAPGLRDAVAEVNELAAARADTFVERRIKNRVYGRLFDRQERLKIGRYDVLETIGHGGMGVVYAAYDDELDRKVAIKLLLGEETESDEARLRFKREAQAMARLSHPNVVTVHEVGEADGRVFIAMEFVRGQSLDRYCCEGDRPWQEVVEIFIQAARGLIAAHEAGLIHRDLKPHNIIRGDDGVVKVLDFGLACGESQAPEAPAPAIKRRDSAASVLSIKLTRAGTIVGTPAYMAPELLTEVDADADALSDQYSFCVALHEALHGELPFAGETLDAYLANVREGTARAPPPASKVPGWVHRLVVRGLDARPERRWPSMAALSDALSRDPSRQRRRLFAGLALAVVTGGGGFAIADLRAPPRDSCAAAAADVARVWSPERGTRIRRAFLASSEHLAADTAARVLPRLDAYADSWATMRVEACERHRGGQHSDRLFDLRAACLDRRLAGFDALVTAFEGADASIIEGAAWAVASLPSIAGCGDVEALTAAVAPPDDPAVGSEVQGLREALAAIASQVDVGAYEDASVRANAVLERSVELGYEPLQAEAHLRMGAVQLEAHRPDLARESLSRALAAAVRSGQGEVAAEALARRMWILAEPLGLTALALHDAELARAFVEHLGDRPRPRWLFLNNYGAALYRAGDASGAERAYDAALAALAEVPEATPIETISTRANLATLLYTGGHPVAAASEMRGALAQAIELLGPDHPRVGYLTAPLVHCLIDSGQIGEALTLVETSLGRADEASTHLRATLSTLMAVIRLETRDFGLARERAEEALALAAAGFPDDHLRSFALDLRALARIGLGEVDEGVADARAALAIEEERLGAEHEDVGHARWWLGTALMRADLLDEAIVELERANTIYAAQGSFAPALLGRESFRLVEALLRRGDLVRAQALIDRTLAIQDEAGFRVDNLHRAAILKLRADLAVARGDPSPALTDYARACDTLARAHAADDPRLAECRLAWSQALGDTPDARELRRAAHDAFMSLGPGFSGETTASAQR